MIARQEIFEAMQAVMVAIKGKEELTTAETFERLGVNHDDFCEVLADFHGVIDGMFSEKVMSGFIYGFLTGLACGRREDYDV